MRLVAYYRVSTDKQGKSGLGLEAQKATVQAYSVSDGSEIVREFTEIESGKKADRPVLSQALSFARRGKAKLVIAKLDRLARNVHFLSGLMESGVDFVACDNPHANRLTVHILAAVAEDETKRISERTKAALAAYRARGGKLGASLLNCRNLSDEARRKGRLAARKAKRDSYTLAYGDLASDIFQWRESGMSLSAIADKLNGQNETTRTGSRWSRTQVKRILDRLAAVR